jgi:adenylosuccinate synthase
MREFFPEEWENPAPTYHGLEIPPRRSSSAPSADIAHTTSDTLQQLGALHVCQEQMQMQQQQQKAPITLQQQQQQQPMWQCIGFALSDKERQQMIASGDL